MTNTSPSTDHPFTGYMFHRNPVDLATMWEMFKTKTAEYEAWAKVVYGRPGMQQSIGNSLNDHFETEKQYNDETGNY